MPPSSYARFNIANRPVGLPETIGSVSTASIPLRKWNEFWDKISHPDSLRSITFDYFATRLTYFLGLLVFFFGLSSFLNSVGLKYLYYPLALVVCLVSVFLVLWWNARSLSKVREICAEYSPVFESAGFRIDCQREHSDDGRRTGYNIYFYPVNLDYLRIEIANETMFGMTTKQSLLLSDHFTPIAVQSVATETWDNFWAAIEKDVRAYVGATRRLSLLVWILIPLIFGLNWIPVESDSFWTLYWIWMAFMIAIMILEFCLICQIKSAKTSLQSTVDLYTAQLKGQGVELELRKEYDWSYFRSFNHITGNLRWCLYIFPLQTGSEAPKLENPTTSHVEMV
jgi:hypothetical protein